MSQPSAHLARTVTSRRTRAHPSPPRRRIPTPLKILTGGAIALASSALLASPAWAETATGPEGQTVTVSKANGLNPDGETITVEGSGFDLNTGIYVVLCVDNGPGEAPTPCLGGVDMEGSTDSSAWISSNPPSYGEGLAQPFDEVDGAGSFSVQLHVTAQDEFTDCLDESVAPRGCVVGTRADHTRTADRSADVLIPVTFATSDSDGSANDGDNGGNADDGGDGAESANTDDESSDTATDEADDRDLAATGAPVLTIGMVAVLTAAAGTALIAIRRRHAN